MNTLEDLKREKEIERYRLLGTLSTSRSERVRAFNEMRKLILERSQHQVKKMEAEIK